MDYGQHYNKLINRAKNRLLETYTEKHHIVPRCMNGSDDPINLVALTPEEHYVAHQLLVKIHPNNYKLVHTAKMMTVGNYRNNKLYGWLRRRISEAPATAGMTGKIHSTKTKRRQSESALRRELPSKETKQKQSDSHKGKKLSENHKKEISNSLKGKPWSEARRAAQRRKNGKGGRTIHHYQNEQTF